MRIISEQLLRDFWKADKSSENALRRWIKIVRAADWRSFADVKNTYSHADLFGSCWIFNAGGNKYRIICKVEYEKHLVFMKSVITHNEYDKGEWKKEC